MYDGRGKETSFTSLGFSAFKTRFDFTCRHCYSWKMFFCDENCEDYLAEADKW